MDFSRIEAQKLLLEERPFDLEDALERALQICCMSAAKKQGGFIFGLGGSSTGARGGGGHG